MQQAPTDKEDTWSAKEYNKIASFVYSTSFTSKVLQLLDAQPGEKIIDFGCGSGEVSLTISEIVQQKPGGGVVGVDASESMISKAKDNGLLDSFVGDLQSLEFSDRTGLHAGAFDAVFSNATLHWCKKSPEGVICNASKCLRSGGRFVAEFGGFNNTVGVRSALNWALKNRGIDTSDLDPWFFPSPEYYRGLLEAESFKVEHIELEPRLTPLNGPLGDWVRLFCRNSWLKNLSDEDAEAIISEVENICEIDCKDERGNWFIMYVRLRFHATKP